MQSGIAGPSKGGVLDTGLTNSPPCPDAPSTDRRSYLHPPSRGNTERDEENIPAKIRSHAEKSISTRVHKASGGTWEREGPPPGQAGTFRVAGVTIIVPGLPTIHSGPVTSPRVIRSLVTLIYPGFSSSVQENIPPGSLPALPNETALPLENGTVAWRSPGRYRPFVQYRSAPDPKSGGNYPPC